MSLFGLLLLSACANKGTPPPGEAPGADVPPGPSPAPARSTISAAECEAQQAVVVGDIGDGAIHKPGYTCASGKPPIADIRPAEGEPVAVEGSVCCP